MNQLLEYRRRYRARVTVPPLARATITPQMIQAELCRWQLHGQVTETQQGYQMEAEFRGATGTYQLPLEVESVEIIG